MTGSVQASGGRPRLRHRRLGVAATLFAAGGAMAIGGSSTAAAQDAPDGEALYQTNCAVCHGAEGEGSVGPVLQGIVDAHGVEEVTNTIRNGVPDTPMQAWEGTLTGEEIDAIVAFLGTLEGEHTHEHDEHDDGHGDDHGDDHDDGGDHDDGHDHSEEPGTGTPAPPVAGDPGFTG